MPLAKEEIDDALSARMSHGTEDLTIVDWNAALIIDRDGYQYTQTRIKTNLYAIAYSAPAHYSSARPGRLARKRFPLSGSRVRFRYNKRRRGLSVCASNSMTIKALAANATLGTFAAYVPVMDIPYRAGLATR